MSHREHLLNLSLRVNMKKSVLLPFPVLDSAHSSVRLNVRRWASWIRRRGASPVYMRRVSSLPHSLDPANPGWCGVIGASEEMRTHATQRTVVMEIPQSYLPEWPFYPVLLLCFLFHFTVWAKGTLPPCLIKRSDQLQSDVYFFLNFFLLPRKLLYLIGSWLYFMLLYSKRYLPWH